MELTTLQRELSGLKFNHSEELEREIQDGLFHRGHSAVVQVAALKR